MITPKQRAAIILISTITPCLFAYAQQGAFTRDLFFGMRNSDGVKALQQFLKDQNLYSDDITGNFRAMTREAVKAFQKREGITPATGYFGAKTRNAANAMGGNNSGAQASIPQPSPPPVQNTPQNGGAQSYDGVITQINMSDGSFSIRLRSGKVVTVTSPVQSGLFVTLRGLLDPTSGTSIGNVTQLTVKSNGASDAIPNVATMDPGFGKVGTKINITGTGFTRTGNSIWIGDVRDAVVDLASPDGHALSFTLPAAPCNQTTRANCAKTVIAPGVYNIAVANMNGVSNATPFQIVALPPLRITTDLIPQTTANLRYTAAIEAIGGADAYLWRISDGALPPGLMLAQGACAEIPCKTKAVISGTPTTPGTYTFTVTLVSGEENISKQFTIVIVQPTNTPNYGY